MKLLENLKSDFEYTPIKLHALLLDKNEFAWVTDKMLNEIKKTLLEMVKSNPNPLTIKITPEEYNLEIKLN